MTRGPGRERGLIAFPVQELLQVMVDPQYEQVITHAQRLQQVVQGMVRMRRIDHGRSAVPALYWVAGTGQPGA